MLKPKRILIVRTDRIGDVILSTPVITNLKLAHPEAHIAFMCCPYTEGVLKGNPYLDEVIVYDKDREHKSFWGTIKFSFYLKKKKFDWAIILHPTNRVHIITFFAGIPFRVGWDRKGEKFLTKKIPHKKQEGKKHEIEYTLDVLRELNIPIKDKTIYFPIEEAAEKKIKELLTKENISKEDKFIVIHPSASCPSKRWPQEYFSQLVKLLKEKTTCKIIVITSQQEKVAGDKIIRDNDVIDFRGELTISEVGSLLKRTAVFISNDSGPVHIASALRTPVISIFGRGDHGLSPLRWQPVGEKSFYFHKDMGCKKCLAHNCAKGFLCLQQIKPEEVAEKVVYVLENTPKIW